MRISDWSSDVCSSDLGWPRHRRSDGEGMMTKDRRPTSLADQLSGLQAAMRENAQAPRNRAGAGRHQSTGSAPESRAPTDVSDMEQQMIAKHALNKGGSEYERSSSGLALRIGIAYRWGRAVEESR